MNAIPPEQLNIALNRYSKEVFLSHQGTPEDSLHIVRAAGMRAMLYDLEVIDDLANHEIVEMAKKTAEAEKRKLQKRRLSQ